MESLFMQHSDVYLNLSQLKRMDPYDWFCGPMCCEMNEQCNKNQPSKTESFSLNL